MSTEDRSQRAAGAARGMLVPPHSDDAERSVLGAVMLNRDALNAVLETGLQPDHFYSLANSEIFKAIIQLEKASVPVDLVTVTEELSRRGVLQKTGGRAYVTELTSDVPSVRNADQYARIIMEKAILRSLISVSEDIREAAYGQEKNSLEAKEILDRAEQKIFDLAQSGQNKPYSHIKDIMQNSVTRLGELAKMEGGITGLPTGFADLDAKTAGLQKGNLIIVAARPAMGKTAFALNIALQSALKAAAGVIVFSMEMSKEELADRLLSMESRTEMQKLKTGSIETREWEDLNLGIDSLSGTNIYIDDTPGISVLEMKSKCRRLKATQGLDLVIIDYLQLMSLEGRTENRTQEVTKITRMLKNMAKELDCPVILLSQLSRGPEQRTDHRPTLADLRESGSIEQDADIVVFLYRDEYYNPETTTKPGVCEVIIAKQRSGSTGTVELTWLGKYTRFVDKSNMTGV